MKKFYSLIVLACINLTVFANVSSYTFTRTAGTYTPLVGGTPLIPPNSGIAGNGWFEQYYNVTLPFVFYFNGVGYSTVIVNSNGFLAFGSVVNGGTYPFPCNAFPQIITSGQSGTIMGYSTNTFQNYTALAGGSGGQVLGGLIDKPNADPILYGTTGTAPNRTFIVQWTNVQRSLTYFASSGAGAESMTFQIALQETTNAVQLTYNTWTDGYGLTYSVFPGLVGAVTSDYNIVNGASWSTGVASSASQTGISFSSSIAPTAGTTYIFTPPAGLLPTACSGTPTAPTAVANVGVAAGGPVSIGLRGLPLSTGLTYQWQSSPTGQANSWANISGATTAVLTMTPTAAAYYQCLLACGAGTPVASSSVAVGYESSYPAIPSYTYNTSGGYPSSTIGFFSISGGACGTTLSDANNALPTFNYTTYGGTAGTQYNYVDYTANPTHLKLQGSTTTTTSFTANINNNSNNSAAYAVWMDLNDNGTFTDAGELLGGVNGVLHTSTNFTITIPANNFGMHRLRIRGSYGLAYPYTSIPSTGAMLYFGETNDYLVEVLPPTPTPSTSSPVCVGGTLTLTSAALTGAIYTWTGPLSYYSTTTSTTQNYVVPSTSATGTYSLYTTVDGSNACSAGTTSVTVNADPSLTSASNSGPICAGSTLTLNANAPSNVTGYSWSGPVTITSPTSATATVPAATTAATGTYTVTVNNGVGSNCTATYTTAATINASPDVSVFSTSASNPCVGFGSVVTINSSSLLAGTLTVTYNLTGANTATGSTASVTMAGGTGTFTTSVLGSSGSTTVTITAIQNALGCSSNVSSGNSFAFTVNPLPSSISGTTVVCTGLSTTLSDGGGGSWTSSNTSIAAIGSTGVVTGTATTTGIATITYTLPTGCITTTPYTVNVTPAITGVTGACVGNTTALGDPTPGGTWSSTVPSVATIGTNGVVTGVTLGTSTISYLLPTTGCAATTLVTITAPPTQFAVTGGGAICAGSAGLPVGIANSAPGTGYQLYLNGSPLGSALSGTGGALSFGLQTAPGIYTVIANPGTSCATNMLGSVSISVNALPTVFNVTGGGGYCAGSTGVHIGLNGSNTSINYQLANGGGSVGSAMPGTGTLLDFGLMTAIGTYSVTATNPVTGCTSNMNGTATVTVNALPTAFPVTGGGSYCAGGLGLPVGVGNSTVGVNYQLYLGGVAVGSPAAGTGAAIGFGNQTIAGTYTVVATNTSTGCTANMTGSVSIVVNPLPTVYAVTGGGSFCAGGTGVHIGLNGSQTGVTYSLYTGSSTFVTSAVGTGTSIDFGVFTAVGTYTVSATSATGCTKNMSGSVVVTTTPLPGIFGVTGGGAYCAGGAGVHVGLSGSALGVNYFLYNGASVVGGASGTTAALDFGLQTTAGVYTVVAVIAATGCTVNMSGSVTIAINPAPTAFTLTGGGSYCAGTGGLAVGLSGSASGTNYRLLNGGLPVGSLTPGTGSALTFGTFTTPGTYTVAATITSTGCTGNMPGSVSIAVNPLPTAYGVTGGGSYCAGGTGPHVGLAGSDISTSYQLMSTLGAIGSPITGTGATLDFGSLSTAGVYSVTATNGTTGCTGNMPGTATVVINALPTAYTVAGGGSYCAGGIGLPVTLSSSDLGTKYQLYRGTTPVGGLVAGTGTTINFGMQTIGGAYTVTAVNTSTGCTNTMSGTATVGVIAPPVAFNVTGGGPYCAGGTGAHVGLSNSVPGVNYQLYNGITAIGSAFGGTSLALDFGPQTTAGTYTVVATDGTSGCTANMTGSVSISINPAPAAFAVTGGGSFCAGGTGVHAGLSSSATGISYQLYNGVSGMGGAMSGTGAALDFGAQTIPGVYTVKGTNTATGCIGNMTGSVTVSVNPSPVLHAVTGGGNYCVGGAGVNIGLDGTTAGTNYQLYYGVTAVGGPVSGTGPAISFGLQTTAGTYTVQASTAAGCTATMSGSAIVGITATPTIYTVTGGGNYCPSGTGVAVGLSGSDPGMSYQLFNGSSVGSPVTGTGSAISFGLQTAGTYTVKATGACTATMSGSVTVGVYTPPTAHNVTGGGGYCSGGTGVSVGLDMGDLGVSYQLWNGPVAEGSPVTGLGSVLNFGPQLAAGSYTVKATDNTTGCTASMTGSVLLSVYPLPVSYNVTGGGGYCAGTLGAPVHLNGSDPGISYQLYNGSGIAIPAVAGTGAALDFGPQPAGVYSVSATNTTTGCGSGMNGHMLVSVNPLPAPYPIMGGGAYCAGGTGVDVFLNGSQPNVRYQLYNGILPVGTAVIGSGSSLDFGLKTAAGTYTAVATDTGTGCVNAMTGGVTVVSNPLPIVYNVTGSSPAYCAGGAGVNVSITGSDVGVVYQLYHNGSAIGGTVPGTGGLLSFGPQSLAGNYTVTAKNALSGCTQNMSGMAPVAINPAPATFTVGGGGSYCSGGTGVHVSLSGSASGMLYQLYKGTDTIGSPFTGSGSMLDFGPKAAAGNYTVTAINPATGCTGNMTGSAVIGINPLPAPYAVIGGGSYCDGGTGVNIGLIGSVVGVQYQLKMGSTPIGSPLPGSGLPLNFGPQMTGGIYNVVATNSITGCSSTMTGSGSVYINPLPSAHLVTGGGNYCAGTGGVHVGISTADAGIRYQLYNGAFTTGSPVLGSGAPLDFGLKTASGTYTVMATDTLTGCVNTMPGSAIVAVNALPAIYAVTGGGAYCDGGTGVHIGLANSASGINYTLYSTHALGSLHGTGGAIDFGLNTAAGTYLVTASNITTGCSDTMTGTAAVAINPVVAPSVALSAIGGDTGCVGRMSHFTAVPSNGGGSPVYQWYVNGTPSGTGVNTFDYVPANGDVVVVKMTSAAVCATPLMVSNSMSMTVNAVERPTVEMSSDHGDEICQGTVVTFTAVPSFGGDGPVYTWVKNGVRDTSDMMNTFTYAPSNGDNVYCILHSNYHCRTFDTAGSAAMHIKTDPSVVPVVVVTASNNGNSVAGAQVILTATVTNGGPSPSYQWYVGTGAVPGATLPVFESKAFNDGDVITCKVTSSGICSGLVGSGSITLHVWNVGVQQITSGNSDIKLIPNPNKGIFTVKGSLGVMNNEAVSIEMTDMLGQVVYTSKATTKNGEIDELIQPGSTLANGMYLLTLRSESQSKVFHVVVEQ